MKNKQLEELMIRFAYGELEDHEIAAAEQLVADSVEAKRLFDIYSIAATVSKTLPEPPSPQLSVERLREAILSKEIKTVSARRLGWVGIAAPTAAAVALAIYVFLPDRAMEVPLPDRVVAEQDNRTFVPPDFPAGDTFVRPPVVSSDVVSEAPKPAKTTAKATTKRSAKREPTNTVSAASSPATEREQTFETVVLINAGPSSSDGTRAATELGDTADVSFGN